MCKQSTSELKTEKAATKRAQLWFSHKSKMEIFNSILAIMNDVSAINSKIMMLVDLHVIHVSLSQLLYCFYLDEVVWCSLYCM